MISKLLQQKSLITIGNLVHYNHELCWVILNCEGKVELISIEKSRSIKVYPDINELNKDRNVLFFINGSDVVLVNKE